MLMILRWCLSGPSILVRVAAGRAAVSNGSTNRALMGIGLIRCHFGPRSNRTGVVAAKVHILLPRS